MPPMGPTNILVISHGFKHEIKYGVAIGAGAGFMDMIYIIISYGGYALIKGFIPDSVDEFFGVNENFFKAVLTFTGCVAVIFSGIRIIKSKTELIGENSYGKNGINKKLEEVEDKLGQTSEEITKLIHTDLLIKPNSSFWGGFIKGSFLCLSSVTIPASWFALTGYMKGYGIIDSRFITGLAYSLGVLSGTTLWFWNLVEIVSRNSHRISPSKLAKLNIFVGVMLIGLGVFLFIKAFDFLFSNNN
jgi:threonine/homoserine/homoserine lactone efflux protein